MRSPAFVCLLLSASFVLTFSSLLVAQRQQGVPAPARAGSIRGTVPDAVTRHGLEHVFVAVDAEDSGYGGQAQTDSSGRFEIKGLDASSYQVSVKAPGYRSVVQHVNLSMYPNGFLDLELHPIGEHQPSAVAPEGPNAALNARNFSVPEKARKEFAAAQQAWQKGKDPQVCLDHLNKAIKIYPDFADAYVLHGTVEIQQNNAVEGKKTLERAIQIDPKLSEAWFTLGMLQNREKNYADAEKSLLQGLQLDENSSQGQYELAKTYWASGKWQQAETPAQKAATLQPGIPAAHVLLGNISLRKNDAAGALKEFQQYLAQDPNGPMADGTRAMIKKIQEAQAAK